MPQTQIPGATDHAWISLHIFYAANSDPLLTEAVSPLVRRLRQGGLVARYFFIRYWLEGLHVRLRLLPAVGTDPHAVTAAAEADLTAFLKENPALYEIERDGSSDELYRSMFIAEYGQEKWDAGYGRTGGMPFRDNNSIHAIPYEREYLRYGGPAGTELSEWHFEKSSDTVLRVLEETNVHVRTVLLGQAVQLALAVCYAFLDTDERVARFLASYRDYWEISFPQSAAADRAVYDKAYLRMSDRLRRRAGEIRSSVARARRGGSLGDLTAVEADWLAHCRQLRERLRELTAAGEIQLPPWDGTPGYATVTDPEVSLPALLRSYVHMTNNRLGVTIRDEMYLAHVLRNAVLEINDVRLGAP